MDRHGRTAEHEGRSRGAQVNALTVKALADPALKARYSDLGATPWPTSPAEIKAFRDSEEARLLPIMKAAGIKPE
jgi:tripartite-type tricarboxylate transporter receptor subunit TctC